MIKKKIDRKIADAYKKKLESIGLVITLKEHAAPAPAGEELALVPTDDEIRTESTPEAPTSALKSNNITCPKCGQEQPPGREQCEGCGVYLQKVLNRATDTGSTVQEQPADVTGEPAFSKEESLTGKSLAAGAAAALVGALVWNFIANAFGYELGLVAWAVGGAVGFAVAATGSRGQNAGIACAALALVAIFGGKYMIYSGLEDEIADAIASSMGEIRSIYDREMTAADAYANVRDDNALRQFMVDHEYSGSYNAGDVTEEEIADFRENSAPRLDDFVYRKPSFDDWYHNTFEVDLGNISTTDIVMAALGPVDILFLFLGVGTAFRLGRG
ncbi:MAG TPA: hypothetical protein ENJ80_09525 [Gammaproteobacteria bacterium]|nr:hypothetical protein [Gammaproteobacteria bacterium]